MKVSSGISSFLGIIISTVVSSHAILACSRRCKSTRNVISHHSKIVSSLSWSGTLSADNPLEGLNTTINVVIWCDNQLVITDQQTRNGSCTGTFCQRRNRWLGRCADSYLHDPILMGPVSTMFNLMSNHESRISQHIVFSRPLAIVNQIVKHITA